MTMMVEDLRTGIRALARTPILTSVAALTIGLGIGLNTTMFSVVNAVLIRPLDFGDSERLVAINADMPGVGRRNVGLSVLETDDLASRTDVFAGVAPVWVFDANLTGGQTPERVVMAATGANYFQLLSASPRIGRVYGPQDRADGFAEAIVVSDAAWHRLFGGDAGVLGRRVRIDTDLYTIVGIMPPGFRHPAAAPAPVVDVWSTAGFRASPFRSPPNRSARFLPSAIARLRDGVSIGEARAAIAALATAVRSQYPTDYPPEGQWSIRIEPLRDVVVGNVSALLAAFTAAVVLVLLIGCANVANLLLARGSTRQREIAVRLAIGATRGRVVRQLFIEHLVLAALGGAIGVLALYSMQSALTAAMPPELPRLSEIRLDGTGIAAAMVITVLTTLACGLAPAVHAARGNASALGDGDRRTTTGRRQRVLRTTLVIAEIALSLVLVAGAGLLGATVARLLDVDPGFEATAVTVAKSWIAVPNDRSLDPYQTADARAGLARRLLEQLRQMPRVSSAAIATAVPLADRPASVPVRAVTTVSDAESGSADFLSVTPEYFSLLNIRLARGRVFRDTDAASSMPVVIIDEEAERLYFPGADAVGRQIHVGRAGSQWAPPSTIVGVVRTVKHTQLNEIARPHVYTSFYQRSGRSLSLFVKAPGGASALQEPLRRAVAAVDPELPVFALEPLEDTSRRSIARQRFSARALTAFAGMALLLVAGGVYSVVSYAVRTRVREFGIRVAIGASPDDLRWVVLKEALRTSAVGVVVGWVLTASSTRLIEHMLFGVSSADPRVFAAAGTGLIALALLASYLPARRAARIDPVIVLRQA